MGAVECCATRGTDATTPRQDRVPQGCHVPDPCYVDTPEAVCGLQSTTPSKSIAHRVLADKTNTQGSLTGSEKHPSRGSVLHAEGQCKRCCFFPRNRCSNGYDCEFCHYEHDKRSNRKRKAKKSGSPLGIDADDDDSEEGVKNTGLEIQLPLSPESPAGDAMMNWGTTPVGDAIMNWGTTPVGDASRNWANTPEGAAVFIQSCLHTVPADTQDHTTAVPVYTPTLWGNEQQPVKVREWAAGERDGEGYQIPRDWALHPQTDNCENRFLPDSGSIILPETAPLTLHQWQDMGAADCQESYGQGALAPHQWSAADHWQEPACEWPLLEAGWEFSSSSAQQSWEWNVHADESYLASWSKCQLAEDPAMATSMCWNSQLVDSQMPAYMTALDGHGDSQMPEYMPAIQLAPAEDVQTPPKKQLPPGVEVAVDLEPPPLSPGSP